MSTTSASSHLSQVARGSAVGLVGAAVSAVSSFLLVVVVTNRFEADLAGIFFTATSTLLLLGAVAGLGTEAGLGRFMLRFEALQRHSDIPSALRAAIRPTLLTSVLLGGLVFGFAEQISEVLGAGTDATEPLRVLAILLPFVVINALALAGTRAFGDMRPTALVDGVLRAGSQPLAALLVSLAGAGLIVLTVAWALPYALAALVSGLLFRALLRRRGPYDGPTSYRDVRREFWSFTWPRAITRVAQMAIQRIDIILVAMLRSPVEAAIYTAATRFVPLGQLGTQAIQQVVQPKFTALLANEEHAAVSEVYRVSTAWSMAISWPIYLVVGSAPLAYLGLFGPGYQGDAVYVVLLMTLAMLFGVASGPADVLLLMSGRSMLSMGNALVAVILDVVLCFVLVPDYGILGAALAWAAAVVTRCTLALVQVHRVMGVNSFSKASGVVALGCVTCLVLPIGGVTLLWGLDVPGLLLMLLACLPAYAGVLYLGRGPMELGVMRTLLRARRGRGAGTADRTDAKPERPAQ